MENKIENKFIIPDGVLSQFFNINNIVSVRRFGHGLVNESYIVEFPTCKYKMVKINQEVYNSPLSVVSNMTSVNSVLRSALIYEGVDPRKGIGTPVLTIDDQPVAIYNDEYWKCRRFIENVDVYRHTNDPDIARSWGKFLGIFHVETMNIHTRTLIDTIKHFHDSKYHFDYMVDTIKIDKYGRVQDCIEEISYIMEHSENIDIINSLINDRTIPRRVCHNDPKLLNFLFQKNSKNCCGIVGMENTMKGSLLYDFGDAIRDLTLNSKIVDDNCDEILDLSCLEAFLEGYLGRMKEIITLSEVRLLYESIRIVSVELATRFITDYLEGDVYFNVKYDNEQAGKNLIRARQTIKYIDLLINQKEQIVSTINGVLKKLEYNSDFYAI